MSTLSPEIITGLKLYEELMLKKRAIENELEMMKSELVYALPRDTEVKTDRGSFCVACRNSWVYSDKTKALKEELKSVEKLEQQNGIAVAEPGEPYIIYKEN